MATTAAQEELERLAAEEDELRREIARFPERERSKTQGRHRDLQGQLEANLQRAAQLNEERRVHSLLQQSVDDGIVIVARENYDDIGECPLCLHDIVQQPVRHNTGTNVAHLTCCNKVLCRACRDALLKDYNEAEESSETTNSPRLSNRDKGGNCPFCREPLVTQIGVYCQRLLKWANAGKPWAQLEIGKRFLVEKLWSRYIPMDAAKAVEWLKVAGQDSTANTSAARANDLLSQFYAEGRPEYGIPESWAQCEKYMTMAARQGHAFAQTQKGANAEDGSVDQVTWFTLAAAQGLPEAMHRLGKLYFKGDKDEDGDGDLTKSWFTSMYWLRQAALHRHGEALVDLCYVLIHAKREVFGHLNVVGHSALPEAAFWMEIGEKYVQGFERPSILVFTNCDNCFVRMPNLKKCAKCKAMGYCSVECQRLHWKAGHKVCCKAVDTYRALFDATIKTSRLSEHMRPWDSQRNAIENASASTSQEYD